MRSYSPLTTARKSVGTAPLGRGGKLLRRLQVTKLRRAVARERAAGRYGPLLRPRGRGGHSWGVIEEGARRELRLQGGRPAERAGYLERIAVRGEE